MKNLYQFSNFLDAPTWIYQSNAPDYVKNTNEAFSELSAELADANLTPNELANEANKKALSTLKTLEIKHGHNKLFQNAVAQSIATIAKEKGVPPTMLKLEISSWLESDKLEQQATKLSGLSYGNIRANKAHTKKLQSVLLTFGLDLGKWGADGDYGNQTKTQVRTLQKYLHAKGLLQKSGNTNSAGDWDGCCGGKLIAALNTLIEQNKNTDLTVVETIQPVSTLASKPEKIEAPIVETIEEEVVVVNTNTKSAPVPKITEEQPEPEVGLDKKETSIIPNALESIRKKGEYFKLSFITAAANNESGILFSANMEKRASFPRFIAMLQSITDEEWNYLRQELTNKNLEPNFLINDFYFKIYHEKKGQITSSDFQNMLNSVPNWLNFAGGDFRLLPFAKGKGLSSKKHNFSALDRFKDSSDFKPGHEYIFEESKYKEAPNLQPPRNITAHEYCSGKQFQKIINPILKNIKERTGVSLDTSKLSGEITTDNLLAFFPKGTTWESLSYYVKKDLTLLTRYLDKNSLRPNGKSVRLKIYQGDKQYMYLIKDGLGRTDFTKIKSTRNRAGELFGWETKQGSVLAFTDTKGENVQIDKMLIDVKKSIYGDYTQEYYADGTCKLMKSDGSEWKPKDAPEQKSTYFFVLADGFIDARVGKTSKIYRYDGNLLVSPLGFDHSDPYMTYDCSADGQFYTTHKIKGIEFETTYDTDGNFLQLEVSPNNIQSGVFKNLEEAKAIVEKIKNPENQRELATKLVPKAVNIMPAKYITARGGLVEKALKSTFNQLNHELPNWNGNFDSFMNTVNVGGQFSPIYFGLSPTDRVSNNVHHKIQKLLALLNAKNIQKKGDVVFMKTPYDIVPDIPQRRNQQEFGIDKKIILSINEKMTPLTVVGCGRGLDTKTNDSKNNYYSIEFPNGKYSLVNKAGDLFKVGQKYQFDNLYTIYDKPFVRVNKKDLYTFSGKKITSPFPDISRNKPYLWIGQLSSGNELGLSITYELRKGSQREGTKLLTADAEYDPSGTCIAIHVCSHLRHGYTNKKITKKTFTDMNEAKQYLQAKMNK